MNAMSGGPCELRPGDPFQLVDARGATHSHLTYNGHDARGVTYTMVTDQAVVQIIYRLWTDVRSIVRDVSGDVSRVLSKKV